MKLVSTLLILTVVALASSCSKNNYAQLEPKDNYYKNSGSGYGQYSTSASTASVSDYQSQHSPVIGSTTLGSPTIQQYEEPFYDSNQNPDLAGQDFNYTQGTQQDYYLENYGTQDLVQADVIPQTNNYFYNGNSPYYTNTYPTGDYFSMSFYMSTYYTMRPWYDPFNPFFSPYYYSVRSGTRPYRRGWYYYPDFYTSYYGLGTACYSSYQSAYNYNGNSYDSNASSNNTYTNYTSGKTYYATKEIDTNSGGRVTNSPSNSRTSISHYTNSDNSYKRRDDYDPRVNQGGRIAGEDGLNSRKQEYVAGSNRRSDTGTINNIADYTRENYQRRSVSSSSPTIQQNNSQRRNVLTISNNKNTRQNASLQNNGQRGRSNYNTNRTNQSSYTSPANGSRTRSSLNQNRSNTSYNGNRNKPSTRSYSAPSRPSSYSAPSRPSSNQRSAPARSSSTQRSSSPKSTSGTRSSSSTSKRKN